MVLSSQFLRDCEKNPGPILDIKGKKWQFQSLFARDAMVKSNGFALLHFQKSGMILMFFLLLASFSADKAEANGTGCFTFHLDPCIAFL